MLILQELFIKVSRLVKFGNVFHCIIKWTPLLVGLVHALLGISRALALYNGKFYFFSRMYNTGL